jgi:hypothetical protein
VVPGLAAPTPLVLDAADELVPAVAAEPALALAGSVPVPGGCAGAELEQAAQNKAPASVAQDECSAKKRGS